MLHFHRYTGVRRWTVTALAAVVVFCAAYNLILPAAAITGRIARETPGIELGTESGSEGLDAVRTNETALGESAGEQPEMTGGGQTDPDGWEEIPGQQGNETDGAAAITTEEAAGQSEEAAGTQEGTSGQTEGTTDSGQSTESTEDTTGQEQTGEGTEGQQDSEQDASQEDPAGPEETAEESDETAAQEEAADQEAAEETEDALDEEENEEEESEEEAEEEETIFEAGSLKARGAGYRVELTYGADARIPQDAKLFADEITEDSPLYEDYVRKTEETLFGETGTASYIRLFDIHIEDPEGEKVQPAEGSSVDVKIELDDKICDEDESSDTQVIHFADECEIGETIENTAETAEDGSSITFEAESFSVYAVVTAPEPVSYVDTATTISDLGSSRGQGGFKLSVTRGTSTDYYMSSQLKSNGALVETDSIENAAVWYFEPVEGTSNQFRIYTGTGSSKKYIRQKSETGDAANQLVWSDDGSIFEISDAATGTFYIKLAGQNRWLQHSKGGDGIRMWTDNKDSGNSRFKLTFVAPSEAGDDPYELDGKTLGIMNQKDNTSAYGMMAEARSATQLASKQAVVRADPMDRSHTLYVAKNSDISMWTFESAGEDIYYLNADGQYLCIQGNSVTLSQEKNDNCKIRVIPGTGSNAGKIQLLGVESNTVINITGDGKGFYSGTNTTGSTSWQNLMEHSVYEEDDFVEYAAYKVSVSDRTNVANGKQVVIYTRVWNEDAKRYEFYAVDHNGELVPCYESGDSIVWIGSQNNTLLWDFTEYYTPGTDNPSGYYELQNTYTGDYAAPQIEGGQIFSGDKIGINLNGRRYGDYYSTIISWDDAHYDYAGYKVENGRIVSCPMAEADTFYFAVMEKTEGTLTPVATVDHEAAGVTMKMVDFDGNAGQNALLDSSEGGTTTNTVPDLLSTLITGGDSGYPTATRTGRSLGDLYTGAETVNHLFIQSIYDGSGYFQFDSSENFAHLNQETGEFEVYQELGTVDGSGKTRSHGQFMPYNMIDPNTVNRSNPSNTTDIYGHDLSDDNPRKYEPLYDFTEADDHHFGMEIEAHFMQPPNGLDDWGHDIIFDFVGDDDFWLYVDGELVIDLGGIHSALGASVNYSTGKAVINGQNTTLYALFRHNYASRNNLSEDDPAVTEYLNGIFHEKTIGGETCYVFKDYSAHTMRIFYMERGAGASNLRMRFNLATVTPGEVVLGKEVLGTDKQDFTSMKFPFQIYCKAEGQDDYQLLKQEQIGGAKPRWRVVYQNMSTPVEYDEAVEIDGVTYEDVFYLKPGQFASIMTPDDTLTYYIRECGVDSSIYTEVKVNGEEVTGEQPAGATRTSCYESTKETVADRTRVTFGNQVDPTQLRTLTIKKRLFNEAGNEIDALSDPTGFTMRLFLGEELGYYNQGDYYIKDPSGNYCRYDSEQKQFVSVGVSNYDELSEEQLARVTFRTSPSGAASKLPAGYSIEIRDILVGTRFKVTEEDYELPVGYGKRTWTETDGGIVTTYTGYKRVAGTYIVEEGDTQNAGVIRDNSNPQVEVHNQRGWGIRANKVWSDEDFMRSHDNTYFAVYIGNELLEGTVHRIDAYNYTTYFFPSLQEGAQFEDYKVYEVKLTDPVVAEDGTVTYSDIKRLYSGAEIELGGTGKDGAELNNLKYRVSYAQGDPSESQGTDDQIRTDIVTNTRVGGLRIIKTDFDSGHTGVPGAEFELKQNDAVVDTYTSDAEGLVTTAYLANGSYTLTETAAPPQYQGMTQPITIEANNGEYTISGGNQDEYEYDTAAATLYIKNGPFLLSAQKVNASGEALPGAEFALYKQITTPAGTVRRDYYPMNGYEDLVTGEDGIIPGISQLLSPGSYYLSETKAPEGCSVLEEDLCFTIGKDGRVTIQTAAYSTWLKTETSQEGHTVYTITVINGELNKVSIWKTNEGYEALTSGASFALYNKDDYDDIHDMPIEGADAVCTGKTDNKGILEIGSILPGEYRLVETEAPAGYTAAGSAVQIFVTANNVSAMQSNAESIVSRKDSEHWVDGQDEENWQIRVWNSSGVVLPSTGGRGTRIFTILGALMILGAGVMLFCRRKAQIRG